MADTIEAFNNSGLAYEELCDDGTHPNDRGYELYFSSVAEILDQCYQGNQSLRVEDIEALNEGVEEFEIYQYYPLADFKKINSLNYELELEKMKGRLGISYVAKKGDDYITIYTSDNEMIQKKVVWNHEFSLGYIEVLKDEITTNGRILLEFSSKEMVDNFEGIIITGF